MTDMPGSSSTLGPVPAHRSRTGLWVAIVVVAVIVLIALACGLTASLAISTEGASGGDAVAVIYIDKEISGVSSNGLGASSITPEEVISQLRKADRDRSVKAIILRINSPGGTASASTEIAMEVARARKPVIASIGDVGASGAYMIASQCDLIMATPASDVGSIGVILGVVDLEDLYKKLGVKLTYLHEGKYKDAGGTQRSLTPTETAMFQSDIHLVYNQFVEMVAKGRKMSVTDVKELATGWAWPGEKAKQLGLVDKLGNYRDAVDEAAHRGGIKGEPRIVTYEQESLGALVGQLFGSSGLLSAPDADQLLQSHPLAR